MANYITNVEDVINVFTRGKFSSNKHVKVDRIKHNKTELAFKIYMFTTNHEYSISLILRSNIEDSYLGCIMQCRKCRPGETHHRGNDLADGRATFETLNNIMADILSCELEEIVVPGEYQPDEDN